MNLAAANPDRTGRLLRHRLRDDRPAQRDGRLAGPEAQADELQRAGLARAGAAGDDGHPRSRRATACRASSGRATSAPSWATPSTSRSPAATACRSSSPASSRSTCSKACCARVRQLEAGRAEVENQYARAVRPRGQSRVAAADRRRLRGLRPQVARHRPDPARAASGSAPSTATTTPSGSSRSTTSRRRSRRVCISGQILQGLKKPHDCPAFGTRVHAADAARRDDGLVRRGLRRLLRLRPPSRSGDRPTGSSASPIEPARRPPAHDRSRRAA